MTVIAQQPLLINYQWHESAHDLRNIDPRLVGNQFQQITKQHGKVTPEALIEANRQPGSPLYEYFEWDNEIAGAKHRVTQGYYVLRMHCTVYADTREEKILKPVRTMISAKTLQIEDHNVGEYIPIARVMSEQDMRDSYVRGAYRTLIRFQEQYHDIHEFARIYEEIDQLKVLFNQ